MIIGIARVYVQQQTIQHITYSVIESTVLTVRQ